MKRSNAVTVAQLDAFDEVIDVRSPAEFALYKQVSPFDAKKVGAALVSKNIARHIEERFRGRVRGWRPLVYCWRGGKRSGAMAHVLREVGWDAATLEGGYRSYRRWVVDQLRQKPLQLKFHVVHGPTGSGKSRLLAALKRAGAQA